MVACSFIKRGTEGSKWVNQVSEAAIKIVNKVITRVEENDPVKSYWHVTKIKKESHMT